MHADYLTELVAFEMFQDYWLNTIRIRHTPSPQQWATMKEQAKKPWYRRAEIAIKTMREYHQP